MPHQCTDCDRTFADGSKEMLSGCPDCGNNQFQYIPKTEADPPEESPPDRPGDGGVGGAVNKATSTVREWVNSGSDEQSDDDRARSGWSDVASDVASEGREDPATRTSSPPPETAPAGFESGGEDATGQESPATPDRAGDDERAYGEWPNPDDADTSGVGKGPGVRRPGTESQEPSANESNEAAANQSPEAAATESASSTPEQQRSDAPKPPEGPTEARDSDGGRAKIELDEEDTAQADARSAVVSPDEIEQGADDSATGTDSTAGPEPSPSPEPSRAPDPNPGSGPEAPGSDTPTEDAPASDVPTDDAPPAGGAPDPQDGRVAGEPTAEERPDLAQLREELNDQFESIKIVSPGTYELNLMELYDRNEYIISLQEDGRYVIEVPEAWRDDEE